MKTQSSQKRTVLRSPKQKVSLKIRDTKVVVRVQQPSPQTGLSLRWSTQ